MANWLRLSCFIVATAGLGVGCKHTPPASVLEGGESASVTLEDVVPGAVLPMATGWVGREPVWFVVDTGAAIHLVQHDLTERARAKMGAALPLEVGAYTQVARIPKALPAAVDGLGGLSPDDAVVVPLAAPLDTLGGLLSPQQFATATRPAVLDLRARSLHLNPPDLSGPIRFTAQACDIEMGGQQGRLYTVAGRIAGQPARLLLDTGANPTIVSTPYTEWLGETTKGTYAGAFGQEQIAHARDVKIQIGEIQLDVPVVSIHGPKLQPARGVACAFDAKLGLDFLNLCTIAMWPDRAEVACGTATKGSDYLRQEDQRR